MHDTKTLLEEENVISLRSAFVMDDGNLVDFRLMPANLESLIPKGRSWSAPKDFEWALQDCTWLFRHMRSASEEMELMRDFPCADQGVKPMSFKKTPEFRLIWTDSGNEVALYLDGEPWAFILETTRKGYSKGILTPTTRNLWDQELFEKVFYPNTGIA